MYDSSLSQPPRGSAGASVAFLSICALAAGAGIWVSLAVLGMVDKMEAGGEVTLEQGLGVIATFVLQSLIAAGAYLVTGLFFAIWMYKVVKFARAAAPATNRTHPGWVWLLVIPVIGHIVPAMMAHAAYTSCRRRSGSAGGPGAAVLAWGVLWAAMWVLYVMAQFTGQPNPFVEGATAEAVRAFWHTHLAYQVVTALTAIAGIVMVVKVSGVQSRLAAADMHNEPAELPPAIMRTGLPAATEEAEPPLVASPAVAERAEPEPVSTGLPGMPPPAVTPEEQVVQSAGLPRAQPEEEEPPRQFMPGIPPPPSQSEAA